MLFTFQSQRDHLNAIAQSNSILMFSIPLDKSILSIVALLTSATLQVFRILNTKVHFFFIEKMERLATSIKPTSPNTFLDLALFLVSFPVLQCISLSAEIISSLFFASFLTLQGLIESLAAKLFKMVLPRPQAIQRPMISALTPSPSNVLTNSPTLTICNTPTETNRKNNTDRTTYISDFEVPHLLDYPPPSDRSINGDITTSSEDDSKPVLRL